MTVDTIIVSSFHVFAYVLGGLASLWLFISLVLRLAGRIAERLWTFEALSRAAMMCAHQTWMRPPGASPREVPGGTREAIARAPLPGSTLEEVDNGGADFDRGHAEMCIDCRGSLDELCQDRCPYCAKRHHDAVMAASPDEGRR